MTISTNLEAQLLSLKPAEQAAIIRMLSNNLALAWDGISKTPNVMGGEACIRDTRIPVWLLVSYQRMGLDESKILANYPGLSGSDLINANAYAEIYPDEIEAAIRRQNED